MLVIIDSDHQAMGSGPSAGGLAKHRQRQGRHDSRLPFAAGEASFIGARRHAKGARRFPFPENRKDAKNLHGVQPAFAKIYSIRSIAASRAIYST
jgi:hypothetical protein